MENKLIEIPIEKGCILVLTSQEYQTAIRRGKAIKRTRAAADRDPVGCGNKCTCKGGGISGQ